MVRENDVKVKAYNLRVCKGKECKVRQVTAILPDSSSYLILKKMKSLTINAHSCMSGLP